MPGRSLEMRPDGPGGLRAVMHAHWRKGVYVNESVFQGAEERQGACCDAQEPSVPVRVSEA